VDEQALSYTGGYSIATNLAWLQGEEIYVIDDVDRWVGVPDRFTGDEDGDGRSAMQPLASESSTHRAYSPI